MLARYSSAHFLLSLDQNQPSPWVPPRSPGARAVPRCAPAGGRLMTAPPLHPRDHAAVRRSLTMTTPEISSIARPAPRSVARSEQDYDRSCGAFSVAWRRRPHCRAGARYPAKLLWRKLGDAAPVLIDAVTLPASGVGAMPLSERTEFDHHRP
ncbi:MAG: hypothetical protein ACLSVD_03850 [Eggerthellaceae bacterium]